MPTEAVVREIAYGTEDYARALALRTRVLREPLGLQFNPEDLAKEVDQAHWVAFIGDDLVGCLSLAVHNSHVIRMRQVVVATEKQGLGIGRLLAERAEAFAKERGFQEIELHSRKEAVPFYLALGYALRGEPFIEVTILHQTMSKNLF